MREDGRRGEGIVLTGRQGDAQREQAAESRGQGNAVCRRAAQFKDRRIGGNQCNGEQSKRVDLI